MICSRIGNFDTTPEFGAGYWGDRNTKKSYKLEFKTTCENRKNIQLPRQPRFPNVRPSPRPSIKRTPDEDDYAEYKEEDGEYTEALEISSISQENIILITSLSVGGFIIILVILVFFLIRRRKAKRKREFMENNPIYGDEYYYNPIKRNEEKVEYYDVTKNNVEKQDIIIQRK